MYKVKEAQYKNLLLMSLSINILFVLITIFNRT